MGYCRCRYWAIPQWQQGGLNERYAREDATMAYFQRRASGDTAWDTPAVQLRKMLAIPVELALKRRTATSEHSNLTRKLFVLKISLSAYNAGTRVNVWRRVACFGSTPLDTLHEKIIGPAMGWVRHHHSYVYIVPTNGACFGPRDDDLPEHNIFTLDASQYMLCHLLREHGQQLIYNHDRHGHEWHHLIEVEHILDDGCVFPTQEAVEDGPQTCANCGAANPPKSCARCKQKKYCSPECQAKHWKRGGHKSLCRQGGVLAGAQLVDGEVNAPPEDSKGCDHLGQYGPLLDKGADHTSREAATSLNWKAHGITNAFRFNLAAHAQRLRQALAGKTSVSVGQVESVSKKHKKGKPAAEAGGVDVHEDVHWCPAAPKAEDQETPLSSAPLEPTATAKAEPCCAECGKGKGKGKGGKGKGKGKGKGSKDSKDKASAPTELKKCTKCKSTWYCGLACETRHLSKHKGECTSFQHHYDERLYRALSTVRWTREAATSTASETDNDIAIMFLQEEAESTCVVADEYLTGSNWKHAAKSYTDALDAIIRKLASVSDPTGKPTDSGEVDEDDLLDMRQILVECLVGRAEARFQLATASNKNIPATRAVVLLRKAQNDCVYAAAQKGVENAKLDRLPQQITKAAESAAAEQASGEDVAASTLKLPGFLNGRDVGSQIGYSEDDCPICMKAWETDLADETVVALACGHAMCHQCLADFRTQCTTAYEKTTVAAGMCTTWACPLCRKELPNDPMLYCIEVD